MDKKLCKKCGANHFSEVENSLICDYCGTEFVSEESTERAEINLREQQATIIRQEQPKRESGKGIQIFATIFNVLLVVSTIIVFAVFSGSNNPAVSGVANVAIDDELYDDELFGEEVFSEESPIITVIPNWTEELYDSVIGMTLDELIDIVGRPTEIFTYSDMLPERFAVWWAPIYKGYSTYVEVIFDEETNLIVDSHFVSSPPTLPDEQQLVLENISLVEGWTREIFDSIEVATYHEYVDGEETEVAFTDGGYFAELEEQLGVRPHSIRTFTEGDMEVKQLMWEYSSDEISIFIYIYVDVETDMIVDKMIF